MEDAPLALHERLRDRYIPWCATLCFRTSFRGRATSMAPLATTGFGFPSCCRPRE